MLPVQPFIDFIAQNHLFGRDSHILAAVSGGMDSVLMARLLKAAGYTFSIAHCNFQLRGAEADADEQFCRELAQELQVPFYAASFDTKAFAANHKISIQMAARELRYQWFEQLQQQHQYQVIALAHHQNDAIETILLNLTRGTGIAGLHGILPKNGSLVRPLLYLGREEVQNVVLGNSIAFREDSSNASTKYARNKIRHEVVPKLKELNPNLENTVNNSLRHFRELEEYFNRQLSALRQQVLTPFDDRTEIDLEIVKQLRPQHLLLYGLLKDFGFSETTVDDIIPALSKHPGRQFYSTDHKLIVDREKLILTKLDVEKADNLLLHENETSATFGGYSFTIINAERDTDLIRNAMFAAVDADKLIYPLIIRIWQQGDYFIPLGITGRKKLSDYFINQKIPLNVKEQIPLLINGNSEIIWVCGYRLDNRYKVTPQTKKVTIFELLKP